MSRWENPWEAPSDRDYFHETAAVKVWWPERTCAECHDVFRMNPNEDYQLVVVCDRCIAKAHPRGFHDAK